MPRTYNEVCRDPAATPIERENALLEEYNSALRRINKLESALVRIQNLGPDECRTHEDQVILTNRIATAALQPIP